ncbi:MAG: DUF434 domain-containing protein [Myxococcales bacterium]|jgi:hypothetical protein
MGDSRRHRGPHPLDHELFRADLVPILRNAVRDLSWLRTRGYAETSALKLVGDRYQLKKRQRVAVGRCACSDTAKKMRASRSCEPEEIADQLLLIDGLNVITTIEVALSGGVLLLGRDECMRDMASFHGNYRLVQETEQAIHMLLELLTWLRPSRARIYIDRPISNSGRLAGMIRVAAESMAMDLEAITANNVDETLIGSDGIVATADSAILDRCQAWLNLARLAVERNRARVEPMWIVDLS